MTTIIIEKIGRAALIRLNRPEALNALNRQVAKELADAAQSFDRDPDIGCIVITGSEKAFAAGADIKEMQPASHREMYGQDWFADWDRFAATRLPTIAAVNGYALGGGCELAMMCDIIVAGETARFGQPEIKLGVMPGMGGTQRLTRLIGKSKAMELCLTGRLMDAQEAERCGLVARIFATAELEAKALEMAQTIAGFSRTIAMMTKETISRAEEVSTVEGVRFERRMFYSMFGLEDQREGMAAYIEKRKPEFPRD
ncbi:enoyl-CoA hydratase [Aureimonas fodinaquatilis]|uniref:enoyl-CoA hydratase n=1 Tax=Aureimonas fodinaquatilis TaxID=2565783 RepID=A0A5B0E3L3_9HYPH|nr:enoyl-CoA hydratase [Aureimonas fodinaquatilis]KAA0972531.1 enoyl-CoA hydratase [Aureimonas fodinaquatilis]